MIAGDHEQRWRQPIEKRPRLPELAAAGPLRQIAGHRNEIRRGGANRLDQRRDDPRIDAPKMNVGKVNDGARYLPAVPVAST